MTQQAWSGQGHTKAPTMDEVYNWDFNQPTEFTQYDKNEARCADNTYRLELRAIRPGKQSTNQKGNPMENAPFDFVIVGEAYKNKLVESDYEGVELTAWINVMARGKEAHLRALVTALLGVDPNELTGVKPSDLIGQQCWAKVSSRKDKDKDGKDVVYTNIDKESFTNELMKVAAPAPNNRQAATNLAARAAAAAVPPAATQRSVATASRQPQPLAKPYPPAQQSKDVDDLFGGDEVAVEDQEL